MAFLSKFDYSSCRMQRLVLTALAKSWNVNGASHQQAFMSNCLTISHTCLHCLPSERMLLFWRDLFVVERDGAGTGGRLVTWEGGKGVLV